MKLTFKTRTGTGGQTEYDVKGHPQHPSFTFATVEQDGVTGRWFVRRVNVNGGWETFQREHGDRSWGTRKAAAEAALEVDLKTRAASEEHRTQDRNVPLALLNALVRFCRDGEFVRDLEQVGPDAFRVTLDGRRDGEQTFILDRKGELTKAVA